MLENYHSAYNLKRYHEKRKIYIDHLGGKCAVCGSSDQLQFDHIDSKTKSFSIGEKLTYTKEVVLEELKKCQLLCKPCHITKTSEAKDGFNKRARGSKINTAKLTEEIVKEIKTLFGKKSDVEIGKLYNIGRRSIGNIKHGVTWKHIS